MYTLKEAKNKNFAPKSIRTMMNDDIIWQKCTEISEQSSNPITVEKFLKDLAGFNVDNMFEQLDFGK